MASAFIVSAPAAADSEAVALANSAGNTIARDEAVSVGGAGNAAAKDLGIAQSAGANSVQNTGISGNQNSTVTVGYDAGQFQTALQTVGTNISSAVNSQAAAGKESLNNVLEKITDLAESKQTDGLSNLGKTVLWALVIGVLGIWAWRQRS